MLIACRMEKQTRSMIYPRVIHQTREFTNASLCLFEYSIHSNRVILDLIAHDEYVYKRLLS